MRPRSPSPESPHWLGFVTAAVRPAGSGQEARSETLGQVESVTCRSCRDRHSGTAGNQGPPKRETCHGSRLRDTCQPQDDAQKGESTKSFAPFDFFGDPDAAQNPTYCGSQNGKAKSHEPRLELGDSRHRVTPAGSAGKYNSCRRAEHHSGTKRRRELLLALEDTDELSGDGDDEAVEE